MSKLQERLDAGEILLRELAHWCDAPIRQLDATKVIESPDERRAICKKDQILLTSIGRHLLQVAYRDYELLKHIQDQQQEAIHRGHTAHQRTIANSKNQVTQVTQRQEPDDESKPQSPEHNSEGTPI